MASIWKHPNSKYWTACYTNSNGVQVKRSTKSIDRNAALQIALEFERVEKQARAGTITTVQVQKVFNEVVEKSTGETIIAPSVEKYLRGWLRDKLVKNAHGTVERYTNTVNLFLKHIAAKAQKPVTSIVASDIESFLNARLESGVAPKTAVVDIKSLSSAFRRAERQAIILKNPVTAVELPRQNSSEREVFTHNQIGKLLDTVGFQSDWFTTILLAYYTGARLTDCVTMKWTNVNLELGCVQYEQQKTGKTVTVPLHKDLHEHLTFLLEFADLKGFLCPDLAARESGGKHGLSESFKRIMKRAGIDALSVQGKGKQQFCKLTFHSLRHSFNSALANAGVSQEIRMKLTGHSSFAMNDRYTHHNSKVLQSAIEVMPNFTNE